MATNTIKTRIQLKCDTEANWNKSVLVSEGGVEKTTGTSFVPREGEVIIYKADDTHPFSRLKVGDGTTNVVRLPFIGSHNVNGIILEETYNDLPSIGNANMLYIVADTLTVYQWSQGNFVKLYNFQNHAATEAPGNIIASTSSVGISENYARQDHTHGIDLATGDANGQVKIAGTNINVKGLDTAAYAKVAISAITDNDNGEDLPTKAQVATYIETKTAGLTGAMHFKGVVNSLPDATDATTYSNYEAGDVVLIDNKEYVYNKGLSASNSSWVLLGDESSYALKNEIIGKNIFNATGQLIYSSAANTPEVLNIPNNLTTPVLTFNNGTPQWKEEYSYTLPTATNTDLGGIKIGYTNSISTDKKYAVQLTNDDKAYVEVNWTDTLYGVAANGGLTITDTPDNQTGKYLLAHSNTLSAAGSSNAGIINNSSETVLDFGDSFYIPQISYDIHGHITEITDTTLTLPDTSDEKVKQTPTSSETQTQWRRLLLGYSNVPNLEVTMNEVTNQAYFYQSLAADAKTGTLRANRYRVLDNVDVEWNDSDASLDFIFI